MCSRWTPPGGRCGHGRGDSSADTVTAGIRGDRSSVANVEPGRRLPCGGLSGQSGHRATASSLGLMAPARYEVVCRPTR